MNFSVLLSIYYKENPIYFRECLDSIYNQTLLPDEVILVEDGPLTKELNNIIKSFTSIYHSIKIIHLKENKGLGRALNEGLKHCTNDLVLRMDTDDICFKDRFEKQVNFMNTHPDIDISSAWLEEFETEVENVTSIKKLPGTHTEIENYIKTRNPLNHPAVIFRKSFVERAGGYQHFPLFEDWYLWARMLRNGAKFANIQECLVHFRTSPEMFKRRGGLKYAINSAKFQWMLHKLGIISSYGAIKASILRGLVYVMPNSLRHLIYSKILRT